MITKRIYVGNVSAKEAEFWGYQKDERGKYFFEHTEYTKEEQAELSAQQNSSYWRQFSSEEILQAIF